MRIGYRRVSSPDQNPERQLEGLHFDEVFTDYASAKDAKRPQLQEALKFCRKGDDFYVHSIDRLMRNLWNLKEIVELLKEKKVRLHFVKEGLVIDGSETSVSTMIFNILGSLAEWERTYIRERQAEGIKIAKKKGVYKRIPDLPQDQIEKMHYLVKLGLSKSEVARQLGMTRDRLRSYLKRHPISEEIKNGAAQPGEMA